MTGEGCTDTLHSFSLLFPAGLAGDATGLGVGVAFVAGLGDGCGVGVAVAAGVAVAFWAGLGLSVSDSVQAVKASERTSTLSVFLSIVETPQNLFSFPLSKKRVQPNFQWRMVSISEM